MIKESTLKTLNRLFGEGVFSRDEVNTGRQIELDIAKGFSILFMIWVHTAETFSTGTGAGYNIVENFLGGPFAAPVFMVCMGIGMQYGRKTEAKDFARRGIGLLITGLILNVFRYVIPMLTIYALSGEKLYLNTFTFLFGVDIACIIFTLFMVINLIHTASAIFRWADRHYGFQASSACEKWVDSEAPDDWMKERFIEWRFIDE